jgi:hypothetical protein
MCLFTIVFTIRGVAGYRGEQLLATRELYLENFAREYLWIEDLSCIDKSPLPTYARTCSAVDSDPRALILVAQPTGSAFENQMGLHMGTDLRPTLLISFANCTISNPRVEGLRLQEFLKEVRAQRAVIPVFWSLLLIFYRSFGPAVVLMYLRSVVDLASQGGWAMFKNVSPGVLFLGYDRNASILPAPRRGWRLFIFSVIPYMYVFFIGGFFAVSLVSESLVDNAAQGLAKQLLYPCSVFVKQVNKQTNKQTKNNTPGY